MAGERYESMAEDAGPPEGSFASKRGPRLGTEDIRFLRPPEIPHGRRVELLRLAEQLTRTVLEGTEPHERCLLRRMVESLLE